MARGRPPKPTALKLLHGNPGKRPISDREPKPPKGETTCPKHLDATAKTEWKRIGLLLTTDLPPRTVPVVKLGFVVCLPFRLRLGLHLWLRPSGA